MARLSREDQIRKALAILQPPAGQRQLCERQIEKVLDVVEREPKRQQLGSKKNRDLFRKMEQLLKQVKIMKSKLAPIDPESGWDQLDVQQWLAVCDTRARLEPQPRRLRLPQCYAAEGAWLLLYLWDGPISRTKGGDWERLTAILYGDPDRNFYGSLII
jgi:hypothetical protein